MDITRKSFVAGAGLAAAAGLAATTAHAVEANDKSSAKADAASSAASDGDLDADVIIVGGGLAGITAGMRLIELGYDPLIIDKADEGSCGNSAIAGGAFSVPMTDDQDGYQKYVDAYTTIAQNKNDPQLLEVVAENGYRMLDFLNSHDGTLADGLVQEEPFNVLYTVPANGAYVGMYPLMQGMYQHYQGMGGRGIFNTKVTKLIRSDDNVVNGVVAYDSEGFKTFHAKAVIIASGGYAGNKEMCEQWIGDNADDMVVRGHSYITGDGIMAAHEVGASLRTMAGLDGAHVAAVHPDNVAFGNPATAVTYCIGINSQGQRFVDESKGYVTHGKAVMNQPGGWDSLIFDSAELQDPDAGKVLQGIMDTWNKVQLPVVQANTVEDLAAQINVDPTALQATLDEYNAAAEAGTAASLPVPKANLAFPISTPPFYAFTPLKPGCTLTFGGLSIDPSAEVLEADGTVIPGLYAAGEATGGFFSIDYIAGGSLARTAVFGLIAAESIADYLG